MKGAAISDVHLGIKQGAATSVTGANIRSLDIERAWIQTTMQVAELDELDLVTIAGDLVHSVHIDDRSRVEMVRGIRKLASKAPVIVVMGNHDAGQTPDSASPLDLLAEYPTKHMVHVVRHQRVINIGGWRVNCIPYHVDVDPEYVKREADMVVIHQALDESPLNPFYRKRAKYKLSDLVAEWGRGSTQVVHAGDYHEFVDMGYDEFCLAFYSGATEYNSSDMFGVNEAVGWVCWDTNRHEFTHMKVSPRHRHGFSYEIGRNVADVSELNTHLALLKERPVMHDAPLLNIKVSNFPREERHMLDWGTVAKMREWCTVLKLDLKYADRPEIVALEDRRTSGGEAMIDALRKHVADEPPQVQELVIDEVRKQV